MNLHENEHKMNAYFFIPVFLCPRRPNLGHEGRPIILKANHFQISMPRGFIHHYDVSIQPDKCPRKVNREIIETMVHAYSKIFGTLKPVFDGRSNLYTRDPLPIGNDRVDLEVCITYKLIMISCAITRERHVLIGVFFLSLFKGYFARRGKG
jgi:hypothetical protein